MTANAGVVAISDSHAVGTGTVTLNGGELRTTATMTLTNQVSGNAHTTDTISAATGTTLTLNHLFVCLGNRVFGSTVSADLTGKGLDPTTTSVTVAAGTLRLVNGFSGAILNYNATTVAAGATLNLIGTVNINSNYYISDLEGAGSVVASGTAAVKLALGSGNFTGVVSGAAALTLGRPRATSRSTGRSPARAG